MKYPIIKGAVLPKSNVGGRPGITEEKNAALEHGFKLILRGKTRVEAANAIHKAYFGKGAFFENEKPKQSQIYYLSKELKRIMLDRFIPVAAQSY